ncbi:alkene reductase [bacterium]|nr:alkene reductase [bacterium]
MSPSSPSLFDAVRVGPLSLANRIAMAPMTRSKAGPGRIATPLMAAYYTQRAGAGLLITEATSVSTQGNGWVGAPGIYTDEQEASWRQVTDAVHAAGGRIFLQLWHMGRASHSDFHDGELPVSASAVRLEGDGIHTPAGRKPYETPRALAREEMALVVADYAAAAARAERAGFDGVEVHAANGYLLDQFLQSKTNHRTDAYGGSVENRYRLLGEVVVACLEAFAPGRVGVRLSPNGAFNDMGSPDFRAQFTYAATQLGKLDLAYLHVVDGLAFGFHQLGDPMTLEDFRAVFPGTLIGACGYDRDTAAAAVARGAADLIAVGRPFITNPDLPARWRHGWPEAPLSDMATWYAPGQDPAGYTEYPAYAEDGTDG